MFGHHPHSAGAELAGPRAEVEALLSRLGHDVSTLDDGGDTGNRQSLADASERFNTGSAQLTRAVSLAEIAVARAITVEGIRSVRLVRTRLGLDPGSEPSEAAAPPTDTHAAENHPLGGLGSPLGAGVAAGLLGLLGGSLLGETLGGLGNDGDMNGGGWGGDGGGWGE